MFTTKDIVHSPEEYLELPALPKEAEINMSELSDSSQHVFIGYNDLLGRLVSLQLWDIFSSENADRALGPFAVIVYDLILNTDNLNYVAKGPRYRYKNFDTIRTIKHSSSNSDGEARYSGIQRQDSYYCDYLGMAPCSIQVAKNDKARLADEFRVQQRGSPIQIGSRYVQNIASPLL